MTHLHPARAANSLLGQKAIRRDYGIHSPARQTMRSDILDELPGTFKGRTS